MRDRDPKGQNPNDENDDDLNWDWLNDAEGKQTGSSDRTGLTGNLDWQSDTPSEESGQPASDDKFDWQTPKRPGQSQSSETGLTGNLDWQGDKPSSGGWSSETGLTGNLDWQSASFPEVDLPSGPDASWDAELSDDADNSESDTLYRPPAGLGANRPTPPPPSTPSDTGQLLDWMADPEGQFGDPSAEAEETPDWMLEMDDAPPPARHSNAAPVELPSWLDDLEPTEDVPTETDEDAFETENTDWTGERTSTGLTGMLEEPFEWVDEGTNDAAWADEDAETGLEEPSFDDIAQPTDEEFDFDAALDVEEPSFEDLAPQPGDEEFDFDAEFSLEDEASNPVAVYPDTDQDDAADEFDFDSLLGTEEEDEAASGDPEFDALFSAINNEPDASVEDPVFEQETFNFDDLGEEGDPVFDNLDLVPLFTSDEDDLPPNAQPPTPAPRQPVSDLDLDAMFGDAAASETEEEDWLAGFDAPAAPAEEEIDFDNFFGATEEPDPDADYIANIVASSRTEEPDDWFAEPAAAASDADWLDSLEDISLDDVIDTPLAASPPVQPARPAPTTRPAEVDLDALFGDVDDSPIVPVPSRMDTFDMEDFPELPDEEIPSFATQDNPDVPDWLREAAASTDDQLSAAGIIRQKYQDRPLESLDDRLRALREAGLSVAAPDERPEQRRVLENVLPGIEETLTPGATMVGSAATLDAALRVIPEHQKNAVLLRSLIGHSSAAEMKQRARSRSRLSAPVWRWLVAAALLTAVILPFFVPIGPVADLTTDPPAAFEAGSPASNAFVRIGTLPPGAPVLVAAEYGPTGASELDPMLRVTLSHLLFQEARPILVSTNPVGLRHAENILIDLAGETNEGRAYYNLGYQPGTLLGLRNLDANSGVLFANYGLPIASLEEVALVLIVAENADTVQTWIEQTRIGDRVPVVIASSAAALPMIVPYSQQGQVAGVLTGYRDAVTYTQMLAGQGSKAVTLPDRPTPIILPTALPVTPTEIPPTPVPVIVTEEATVEATEALVVETEEPEITPTLDEPTATEERPTPTQDEPEPTETREPTATNTPMPLEDEPTATTEGIQITPPDADNLVEVAIVIASNTVNTRSGPGTTFDIVRTLAPGAQVRVLGYNDDQSWVNIVLPDGTDAWIAEALVAIRELPASEAGPITPQPPRRSQSPRGRRVAQIPTVDPSLLLTQQAVLTQSPGLELTGAAALTQVQIPGLEETQAAVLTQASVPGFELTQASVLTQSPGLELTGAAALTQVQIPGLEETQAAVLTQASVPGFELTQAAVLTQSPGLELTGAAALTQVPGPALTPGGPIDENTLLVTAPVLDKPEQRWNATTFGLAAAIVIIVLGNLVAGLRALLRRNR